MGNYSGKDFFWENIWVAVWESGVLNLDVCVLTLLFVAGCNTALQKLLVVMPPAKKTK